MATQTTSLYACKKGGQFTATQVISLKRFTMVSFSDFSRWKNTDPNNPYLFPILETGSSAKTIKNRCKRFLKWVNKRMYEISQDLGIENKTSTYAARHSFSTV